MIYESTYNKFTYIYYLRVLSSLAVIILHISAQGWSNYDIYSTNWTITNIIDSMVRCAVPLFIMISGAIFLNKEISIKKIYSKYIFRLIIAYLFWSIVYASYLGGNIKQIIGNSIKGHYHMWFIPMIIGIYMTLPILNVIKNNTTVQNYILIIGFIIIFVLPETILIINDFGTENMIKFANNFDSFLENMGFFILGKYTYYFIIGHYINSNYFNKRKRFLLYIMGIVGTISTIVLTYISSIRLGHASGTYYNNFTVGILLESISIFVLFKKCFNSTKKIIENIAEISLGIYLVHALYIDLIIKILGNNFYEINPLISIPLFAIIVFVVSSLSSYCIHNIPLLGRYIS